MKYLENVSLETLSNSWTGKEIGSLVLSMRVELYTTKKTHGEKKETKVLESRMFSDGVRERSESTNSVDPALQPKERKTRKLLIDLIQTLTIAHTDYDFSSITADSFEEVTAPAAMQQISVQLAERTMQEPDCLSQLWRTVDDAMDHQLQLCQVFILRDPWIVEDEEVAWAMRFFFCSYEARRVLYFAVAARSKYHDRLRRARMLRSAEDGANSGDDDDDDDDDDDRDEDEGEDEDEDRDNDSDASAPTGFFGTPASVSFTPRKRSYYDSD